MGQKTNPVEIRLGNKYFRTTNKSSWFAKPNDYASTLNVDIIVRKVINDKFAHALISEITIERSAKNSLLVNIYSGKPGIITGKGGATIQELLAQLKKTVHSKTGEIVNLKIIIKEVKKPEYEASLIAKSIATSIEKRVMPKKAMKREIDRAMRATGISGIKVIVSGRIGGADIARSEKQAAGRVPLHTFKANIKYHSTTALTTYGIMGIKVWLFVEDTPRRTKEKTDATTS